MFWSNLLGKLTLGRKFLIFAVLGALLVAAPLIAYLLDSNEAIAIAQREREGIRPAQTLLRVIQLAQQHHGLAVNVLAGNAAMESQRASSRESLDKAANALARELKNGVTNPAILRGWNAAETEWKSLAQASAANTLDASATDAGHTALLTHLRDVLDLVADHYGLSLDPEADGYHLMMVVMYHLPQLSEALGQARARGTMYLSKTEAPSAVMRSEIRGLMALGQMHARNAGRALEKAFAADAQLKGKLTDITAESQKRYDQVLKLTREQWLETANISTSSADYFRIYTEAIDAQFKLNNAGLETLDGVLTERISALRKKQLGILTIVLLTALLAAGLGYGVMRSITLPLAQAAGMAQRFSSGDLT
ncbi:MAG TPA: hypothetical protein VK663_14705, partial [Burkholderiales bacterium]|nr:hypothetical protein [Burkholderiales bacterium]